jgi:hypothetical protein
VTVDFCPFVFFRTYWVILKCTSGISYFSLFFTLVASNNARSLVQISTMSFYCMILVLVILIIDYDFFYVIYDDIFNVFFMLFKI